MTLDSLTAPMEGAEHREIGGRGRALFVDDRAMPGPFGGPPENDEIPWSNRDRMRSVTPPNGPMGVPADHPPPSAPQ